MVTMKPDSWGMTLGMDCPVVFRISRPELFSCPFNGGSVGYCINIVECQWVLSSFLLRDVESSQLELEPLPHSPDLA